MSLSPLLTLQAARPRGMVLARGVAEGQLGPTFA
jgi:hypothetical protein